MEAHTLPAEASGEELAENPRLNVDCLRTMMSAAGQKQMKQRCVKHIWESIKQQKQALADSKKKK